MFNKIKRFLLVPILIGAGIGMLYAGVRESSHAKALATHGKVVEAVVEQVNWTKKRGSERNFKLDVRFTTEAGKEITTSISVSQEFGKQLRDSERTPPVKVKYLPEDPSVVEMADHTDESMGMFAIGGGLLAAAAVIVLYRRHQHKTAALDTVAA